MKPGCFATGGLELPIGTNITGFPLANLRLLLMVFILRNTSLETGQFPVGPKGPGPLAPCFHQGWQDENAKQHRQYKRLDSIDGKVQRHA